MSYIHAHSLMKDIERFQKPQITTEVSHFGLFDPEEYFIFVVIKERVGNSSARLLPIDIKVMKVLETRCIDNGVSMRKEEGKSACIDMIGILNAIYAYVYMCERCALPVCVNT